MEKKLPEGWEWKRLKDVAELIMGQSPPGDTYNEIDQGMPFLQGKSEFGDVSPEHVKYTTKPLKIAPNGSVLMSVRAPVGDVNIADIDYCIGRGLASLSLHKGENVFLFYVLNYFKNKIEKEGTGSTFKAITKSKLQEFKIPHPPLKTQRKIVAILEKADETKRLRVQADELTDRLLQSVFLEMFGDPVKNPKGWEIKELKEMGFVKTGNTPPRKNPDYYGNYIEWIKSDNINTPYTYLTKSEEMLSEEGVKVGRTAPKNSVLVTCIAGSIGCIGNVAIADRDVAFNQQINAIIPKEHLNDFFLYYLILSSKSCIQNSSTRGMKGMISKGTFESLRFICPPSYLQDKFRKYAEEVEKLKNCQKRSQQEIDNLFNALMQKAFKGELVA